MTIGTARTECFRRRSAHAELQRRRDSRGRSIPASRRRNGRRPSQSVRSGPEVLSYQLVRAVLRDDRFQIPPGIVLQAQGVTSGPLWDKVINSLLCVEGETHRRLRGLCSKAFTPRTVARLHDAMVDVMNDLVEPGRRQRPL